MPRKPNKLPKPGFCLDMKTGRISEVVSITRHTLDGIQKDLNMMYGLLKDCHEWEHDLSLDQRIADFMLTLAETDDG